MKTLGNTYGTRQGSAPVLHSYPVNFNTTGIASAVLVDVIKASADNPVQVEVTMQVITAFNGTTPVLTVGTTTTATEWLAAGDITEATPGYYGAQASVSVGRFRLTADTNVYVKFTATTPTTGFGILLVREASENTTAIA